MTKDMFSEWLDALNNKMRAQKSHPLAEACLGLSAVIHDNQIFQKVWCVRRHDTCTGRRAKCGRARANTY